MDIFVEEIMKPKTKLRKRFDSLSKEERDAISKEMEDIFVFEVQKEIDKEFIRKLQETDFETDTGSRFAEHEP